MTYAICPFKNIENCTKTTEQILISVCINVVRDKHKQSEFFARQILLKSGSYKT